MALSLIDVIYRKFPDGTLRAYGRPNLGGVVIPTTHGHAELCRVTGRVEAVPVPDPVPGDRVSIGAGAAAPGTKTYPIPTTGTNRFVDPQNGNDTTGTGLIGAPWKTIQRAINLTGSNANILVRGGSVYEGGAPGVLDNGVTVSGDTRVNTVIQPYLNEAVWWDGTDQVTGWITDTTSKPGSTIWRVPYTISLDRSIQFGRGSVDGTTAGYIWLNASDPRGKIANVYDQVFTDDGSGNRTALTPVATLAEVTAGKFFVAGALRGGAGADKMVFNATTLYIGTNPASVAQIRVSTRTTALAVVAPQVTIRGFGFRGYAAGNCDGGVVKARRTGGVFEDLTVVDSAGVGFDVYLNTRPGPTVLRNATIIGAGLNCVHVEKGDGFEFYDCNFQRANTHNWMMAPAAGGMKVTSSVGVRGERSVFNNNNADGFWCDASVFDCTLVSCDAKNNNGHGFEYEISSKALLADCLAVSNGKSGILIRCSDATQMWYCTTSDNAEVNMDVTQDNRRINTGVFGQDARHSSGTDPVYGAEGMDWIIQAVTVKNCVIVNPRPGTSGGTLRIRSQPKSPDMPNSFALSAFGPVIDGNVYGRANAANPAVGWVLSSSSAGSNPFNTFAAYKAGAAAQGVVVDSNSVSVDGANPLNADYSLKTSVESAALAVVPGMPTNIAALLGRLPGTKHVGAFL